MKHLDEGLMMALLDGELSAGEQREAEQHIDSCPECSSRLAEARLLMAEADGLVEELIVPPATSRAAETGKRTRWLRGRNLAWAASVVAALGLGITGGITFFTQSGSGREVAISPQQAAAPIDPVATPSTGVPPAAGSIGESRQVPPGQPATGAGLPANQARPSTETARLESDRTVEEPAAAAPSVAPNAFGESGSAKLSIRGGLPDSPPVPAAPLTDAAGAAGRAAPAPAMRAQRQAEREAPALVPRDEVTTRQRLDSELRSHAPAFRPISMEEAVHHLGGVIRLVDGLTPEGFEVAASDSAQPLVRVTYRVGQAEIRLFLEQRRTDNSFVASDLQRLNSTVEQALTVNRLSWNDLGGFALTLSGQVSPDSLSHFKSLVK
jgi:hypothetical protein